MANNEQLSALMDAQGDAAALSHTSQDPAAQQTWARYHLIKDALRGDLPSALPPTFCANVMAALDAEPPLAQPSTPAEPPHTSAIVIPLWRKTLQQVGQYAIAASVAAAVIVGVQQVTTPEGEVMNPVLNTIPVGGSATPVSVHYDTPPEASTPAAEAKLRHAERERINSYLRDHQLQQQLTP
ncbi:MAG: sigma-E factor negative regulatory protein [Aeromonas sp.]